MTHYHKCQPLASFTFSFSQGFALDCQQGQVPWKQIKDHTADFICDIYLSEVMIRDQVAQLEDPSNMKKEQITWLLEHWRRTVPASDLFRFSHVLVNSNSNSLGPLSFPHNSLPSTTNEPVTGAAT